ncbi:MAG: hydantoinase/oxoprolinase family protein [Rhodobacteraceae bacterium]|nr:hydantoinase/oxoprolinase family protein [Alphaproteobacteria bacterium]NNK67338.1 hydantoinase/oxoprolinase family protein [Paracoccaceae bacterium]
MKRIGIDVGGTNTDAVVIEGTRVLASIKVPTTRDVMTGVVNATRGVLAQDGVVTNGAGHGIDAVMLGTTHFTNAVVERANLERIAVIRISLPASSSLPPGIDWPGDIRAAVDPMVFMVAGGHEYDGRPLVPLDRDAITRAAQKIAEAGVRSVAINALFSPLTSECEDEAAEIVRAIVPDVHITLAHTLGRIGLLERENVAMLNASLQVIGRRTIDAFGAALSEAGIDAPFYLTQNDGTVVMAEVAAQSPVFSFASGPTNSMRGAAFLTGLDDAMVADVGGTTTDIGCLVNGFPREANNIVKVGGVRTLFRMPDLLPIGLGGGSIVDVDKGTIGPRSVGYRITDEALVFGGQILTATDLAVAAGRADIGDPALVRDLDPKMVKVLLARTVSMLEDSIDRMKTSPEPVDLIAVGGGAFLIPDKLAGVGRVHRLEQAGVANAIGAAMAQVSGEVDQVFSGMSRESALADADGIARDRATKGGASPDSIKTIEVEDIPIAYLPGDSRRVRVRVVGDISQGSS